MDSDGHSESYLEHISEEIRDERNPKILNNSQMEKYNSDSFFVIYFLGIS